MIVETQTTAAIAAQPDAPTWRAGIPATAFQPAIATPELVRMIADSRNGSTPPTVRSASRT